MRSENVGRRERDSKASKSRGTGRHGLGGFQRRRIVFEVLEDRRMLSVSLNLNGPQTIVPGATIRVGSSGAAESEMQIVVNPTNPLNVVGFSHRVTTPIISDVYSSADGGATWSTNSFDGTNDDGLGAAGNRFDPALTFDANGTLYIVYGHRETNQTRLVGATSTDGGVTFGNFRTIDLEADIPGTPNATPGVDKWYVASGIEPASGGQAVYVAYVNFGTEGPMGNTADDRILVAGTRDGGANWTAPIVINDPSIGGAETGPTYGCPVVGRLGELAVSWHDMGNDTVMLDRDLDGLWAGGANFGTDVTVRTGVTVDRAVNLPPAQPQRGINAAPMLEVWKNLGILYMAVVEQYEGNDLDIWVGKSTDWGDTWSFNRIDESFGTEFNPWLQVDQRTGAIGVLYYTTDGDVATGNDDVRVRLATSFDAGTTWSRTFLSAQTSNEAGGYGGDYLEYIGLDIFDGTVHGLWSSRFPMGGTDLDAFTANAAFVSSTGGNNLFIGESGSADDYYEVRQSPANSSFLEVFVDGIREFTGLIATIDNIIFNPGSGINTFNIGVLAGIASLTINGTNNVDVVNMEALGAGTPLAMVLGGGGDVVSLAPNNPFAINALNAPITIFGQGGGDVLNVGSGGLHAVSGLVTFDAGALGEGNSINLYDGANPFFVDYTIGETSITRDDPFFFGGVNYSGVGAVFLDATQGPNTVTINATSISSATVNGNGGNDNFVIGNGNNLAGGIGLFTGNGGEGIDTLTLNDSLSTHDLPWAVLGNGTFDPQTIYLGLQAYDLEGYEGATILAGNGNNNFQVNGTMAQAITLNAGGGSDTIELNGVSNFRDFYDQDENPPFNYPMVLDGGDGFNVLIVDDAQTNGRSYVISPAHMTVFDGAPLGLSFDYDSFGSVNVYGGQYSNDFLVFGTSSDIPAGQQMTILGGPEPDAFEVRPHDDLGNLTINGNLGIGGGGGVDSLVVNDTFSSLPINYSFYNQFGAGTTNIGGLGAAGFGAGSNIENITVSAGGGDDSFDINTFQSGSALAINGGGGNDTLNFGSTSLAGVTNMASFHFNGQDDTDTFNLNNGATNDAWTYNRGVGSITASSNLGAFYSLTESNVESMQLSSGAQADSFYMNAVAAGTRMTIYGGDGADGLALGAFSNNVESIQGPVAYYGEAGGGHLAVYDTGDTTGDTFHVEQYDFLGTLESYIGLHTGDNLFGPGGSLYATGLTNYLDGIGVRLNLGSGADTIYAQPLTEAVLQINGNNPTAAPGDTLNLALAQAQDYVITGTTSGNVTSSNLQTLFWTGIEASVDVDDVAPAVIVQGYEEVPESRIYVEFSEDVSSQLDVAYLYLFNTTVFDYVPFAVMSVVYDSGTNTAYFTFPGYANGRLPGGDYEAAISGSLPDFYGNPLGVEMLFTFTVEPPLAGDFDLDNTVGPGDYDVWKAAFGDAVAIPGSGADGNGDGIVDAADFTVWRDNLGATRSAGAGAIALRSAPESAEIAGSDLIVSTERLSKTSTGLTGGWMFDVQESRDALQPRRFALAVLRDEAAVDNALSAWLASKANELRVAAGDSLRELTERASIEPRESLQRAGREEVFQHWGAGIGSGKHLLSI